MDGIGLRVVRGGAGSAAEASVPALDPVAFQEECLQGVRGFPGRAGLQRADDRQWCGDVAAVPGGLRLPGLGGDPGRRGPGGRRAGRQGMAASTRRCYVQAFKDFHGFLVARKAAEIEATFGVRLDDPVDEFNAARHVGNDSPSAKAPPTPERMEEFFAFLRERVATARKFGPAGPGLRAVPDAVSRRAAGRRGGVAGAGRTCISAGARSARSTCGSARAPRPPGRGRGGCRCWTSST